MDPEVPGRRLAAVIEHYPYDATVLDTTVTLEPGLYYVGGQAANCTAGRDCLCSYEREGTVTWKMVVQ